MSTPVAPLLEKLIALTEARVLRWEPTASEDTYIASQRVPTGVLVFEISLEDWTNAYGDVTKREALHIKRTGGGGVERKLPVQPGDASEWRLLETLWQLASSAETNEFLEDVLKDLGGSPAPPPPDEYGPIGVSEDPFGDQ